jgi:hypothetical protein
VHASIQRVTGLENRTKILLQPGLEMTIQSDIDQLDRDRRPPPVSQREDGTDGDSPNIESANRPGITIAIRKENGTSYDGTAEQNKYLAERGPRLPTCESWPSASCGLTRT